MSTETVPAQNEEEDHVVELPQEPVAAEQPVAEAAAPETPKEERVPLRELQKERKKRQEAEQELRWHKEQMMQKPPEAPKQDETMFEAATKEDLGKSQQQIVRIVEERNWIKQNPEKAEEVKEKLAEFLKQRPNLASAIEGASNRYEEAWELMDKLNPKQKAALVNKAVIKKDSPGSPSSSPKAAPLNQAVEVMAMSDSEFNAWRQLQRKRK